MTNTNSFKPGDRVEFFDSNGVPDFDNYVGKKATVLSASSQWVTVEFEDGTPNKGGMFKWRFKKVEAVEQPKINIETMKKESLAKIQALVEAEVNKFTDIGLNAEFIMRFSNRSNTNITSLDLSA